MNVLLKSIAVSLTALLSAGISYAQGQSLKLDFEWGTRDTTYTKSKMIIGSTEPGAEVFVRGEKVKVYKTGSFGWQGDLSAGNNIIIVKAVKGALSVSDTLNIFYSLGQRPVPPQGDIPVRKDTSCHVTTLEGAFFNYSDGDDRLGGAKVCFVCEGIPLEVVQKYGDLYKVKVSDNHYFHIPAEYTSEGSATVSGNTNSGSWSVEDKGDFDRVSISLGGVHPYTFKQSLDPLTLNIDIYGVQCNSNWITQHLPLGMIKYVDFEQPEYDVFRVKIALNGYSWGTRIKYAGGNMIIDVMHAPALTLKGMVIGVDAGHGGPSSSGAISICGMKEKDLNLEMAYMLKKELEKKGATVILSRSDDSPMAMSQRKKIFLDADIDLMVSIHCNAGGSPFTTGGASCYYKYIHNRKLAELILNRARELDGVRDYGLVGNFNFSLNGPMEYPNVLVETQFLSNFEDEERIADPAFRLAYMKKVVLGIEDYLKFYKKNAF